MLANRVIVGSTTNRGEPSNIYKFNESVYTSGSFVEPTLFNSNGEEYTRMRITYINSTQTGIIYENYRGNLVFVQNPGGMMDEKYRVIELLDTNTISEEFKTFLANNARNI